MASIRKRGDTYQITVCCGYSADGTSKIRQSTTWKPSKRSQMYSIIGAKKAVNLATILATIWRLYVKNSRQKSLNDTKR